VSYVSSLKAHVLALSTDGRKYCQFVQGMKRDRDVSTT